MIFGRVVQTSVETIPLEDALGRTLAEAVQSDMNLPPFDNSAMDGYAVRASDVAQVPALLPVSQEIQAGQFPDQRLAAGTCARIMTGAPLPAGADLVIPIEWTEGHDPIHFGKTADHGHAVRCAGEDIKAGQIVFGGGELVTPPVVGMLAAVGCAQVPVRRRPLCAVVTTGNELVDHGETPLAGQIRNSNGPALAAQVCAAGGVVSQSITAPDDPRALQEALKAADDVDILILSGGVSVGAYDFVKRVLLDLGVDLLFWRVLQRPGKPLLFGVRDSTLVFGLPGNPVSSSICFDQYVRPSIGRMLGRRSVERRRRAARFRGDIKKVRDLRYFARGFLSVGHDGTLEVSATGPQGSGLYSSMVHADCIIHLPAGADAPRPGDDVEVELLTWWD